MKATFTFQDYQRQRKHREDKRNQYLRRFQSMKAKISSKNGNPITTNESSYQQKITQTVKSISVNQKEFQLIEQRVDRQEFTIKSQLKDRDMEQNRELEQNQRLKQQLGRMENVERQKLLKFKSNIQTVKEKYIQQIQNIQQLAAKSKKQLMSKINSMRQQTTTASKKNEEIEEVNKQLKEQVDGSEQAMEKYLQEIRKQYTDKLAEFQEIFNGSNQKISAMEKQYNQEELVENSLKNQDLLKSIQQSNEKADDLKKILDDYTELNNGKSEILAQVEGNIQLKQKEITKMRELQQKINTILNKMNEEKKVLIQDNKEMAKQISEISALLSGKPNQS